MPVCDHRARDLLGRAEHRDRHRARGLTQSSSGSRPAPPILHQRDHPVHAALQQHPGQRRGPVLAGLLAHGLPALDRAGTLPRRPPSGPYRQNRDPAMDAIPVLPPGASAGILTGISGQDSGRTDHALVIRKDPSPWPPTLDHGGRIGASRSLAVAASQTAHKPAVETGLSRWRPSSSAWPSPAAGGFPRRSPGDIQAHARPVRGFADEAGILGGHLDGEVGGEVAVQDRGALRLQVAAVERAMKPPFQEQARIEVQARLAGASLGGPGGEREHPAVEVQRAEAVPGSAASHSVRWRSRRRPAGRRPGPCPAGDQDGEGALLGGLPGAEHGGVQEHQPVRVEAGGQAAPGCPPTC